MWKRQFRVRRKNCKVFSRVHLAAGESQRVTVALDDRAFAFFDLTVGQWRIEAGAFEISTGFSARDMVSVTLVEKAAALLAV